MANSPQFKSYPKKELKHINIKVEKTKEKGRLFSYNGKINLRSEEVAKEYYKNQGYDARFSENNVWKELFNRIVYKKLRIAYHEGKMKECNRNKFDDDFYYQNKDVITQVLEDWRNDDLNKILKKKEMNNPRNKIRNIINYLENDQVLSIMEFLSKDYIHRRSGFPDIIVWNEEELFFVEVKSKGDTLTRKQTRLHNLMLDLGIDVRLFTINMSKESALGQLEKYQHEYKATKSKYHERYNEKIEIANREYAILEKNETRKSIEGFKKPMIDNGTDYFIAYLIILNDLGVKNLNEINQHKGEIEELIDEKEKVIEKLRIMGKGRKLEDKKMFDDAIETYMQLKTYPHKYEAYKRICICYRKKKDYYNEILLMNRLINDESIPKYHHRIFKRRLKRLLKTRPQYEYLAKMD